ncbi:gluconokinase [Amycolatopsis sp. 195334CR]|uniref:gluconokinase n=1 Tax=Amycolatopsis sp. 195334CR TaxID=2814588 RepID=UPI001A90146D|nr:gluconokinase [Amycolatopsis sp. 195334CR]MBN6036789.1 gluconokinase [Amycolatopsis sp. 195334CR]
MTVVVVMGVSGSGKTTVGTGLAEALGVAYAEADSFHPEANIEKMTAGTPLTDEDRWPWLDAIAGWIREHQETGGVVTSSALKRRYRDVLRGGGDVWFVHLDGPREVIAGRMAGRSGHFMPPSLLDSQIADLEPLAEHERGVVLDITESPEAIIRKALDSLP